MSFTFLYPRLLDERVHGLELLGMFDIISIGLGGIGIWSLAFCMRSCSLIRIATKNSFEITTATIGTIESNFHSRGGGFFFMHMSGDSIPNYLPRSI